MSDERQPPEQSDNPYAWLDEPAPWHPDDSEESAHSAAPQNTEPDHEATDSQRRPINRQEEVPHISSRRIRSEKQKFNLPEARTTGSTFWQTTRTMGLTIIAALLIATIFSYWTPEEDFLPDEFREQMQVANTTRIPVVTFAATPLPTEVQRPRIGIIAGHSGPPADPDAGPVDPGAVCFNDAGEPILTELEINTDIAEQVVRRLREDGFEVDLLEEFDPRLENYRAELLISIHTNDCSNYGLGGTGYNVAGAAARQGQPHDEFLVRCLIDEYGTITELPRHYALTEDMTSYHTFREISIDTPVAIIETGFMLLDRQMLTGRREVLAQGILSGVYCFLEPRGFGPYASE